ncbi:cytidylyltransferase family protein [Clostridium botulinum 202F]|nr:cytidylyltransferase family protein [Clostridium botulinum 202F]
MNVICIVQARMGSERLPGKVIKPILGKPMILYTLDRLSKSRYIDKLILATSEKRKKNL